MCKNVCECVCLMVLEADVNKVISATEYLETVYIPEMVVEFEDQFTKHHSKSRSSEVDGVKWMDSESSLYDDMTQLVADMHLRGINIRYLMLLHEHAQNAGFKRLLLNEMVVRCTKNEVRRIWRSLHCSDPTPYIAAACEFFNVVFKLSATYVNESLVPAMVRKFRGRDRQIVSYEFLQPAELDLCSILFRLRDLLGIRFAGKHWAVRSFVEKRLHKKRPFKNEFFEAVLPVIRHTHRVSFEEGTALSRLALTKNDHRKSSMLFMLAYKKYEASVQVNASDHRAFYNWALSECQHSDLVSSVSEKYQLLQSSLDHFNRCLILQPTYWRAYFRLGLVLMELVSLVSSRRKKRSLLHQACTKLTKAYSLKQNFDICYNLGNAYLHLANLYLSQPIPASPRETRKRSASVGSDNQTLEGLLSTACDFFRKGVEARPESAHCLHNWAVCCAKQVKLSQISIITANCRPALA